MKRYEITSIPLQISRKANEMTDELMEGIKDLPGSRFNSENERRDRYYGILGELIFKDWLDNKGIEYDHGFTIGSSDDYDFLVKGLKIDVKTAVVKYCFLGNKNFYFLINDKQPGNGHADIYVHIVIHKGAVLNGYIFKDEIREDYKRENKHTPAYHIPQHILRSMRELESELRNRNG